MSLLLLLRPSSSSSVTPTTPSTGTASSPTLTWRGPTGTVLELTATNGINLEHAPIGLDAPPVELSEEGTVGGDGAVLLRRRYPPRMLVIPIYIETGRARDVIVLLTRSLVGPGELVFDDGTVYRTLRQVHYSGGLEGTVVSRPSWARVAVVLRALDPWWYGSEVTLDMNTNDPMEFDAVEAFDDAAILFDGGDVTPFNVAGDAAAFPRFVITGPFTTLTVGVPGGAEWEIAAPLAGGSTLTVDTRPGSRGPSLDGGAVDWSLLTPVSRLFTMIAGVTSLAIQGTGMTGASAAQITYEPRYLTV